MATNPSTLTENIGRIIAPSAGYPYGSAKDDTTGTTGDGTPFKKAIVNDTYGFQQWLLARAGIVPSGDADTALVSQYGQAMLEITGGVGGILTRAVGAVPAGALECDGSIISRTTYAALYAVIGDAYGAGDGSTTFSIPDFRGAFLRGWDNGRGIDPARAIASLQLDAFQDHTYAAGVGRTNAPAGFATGLVAANGVPVDFFGAATVTGPFTSTAGAPRVAQETRPTNVAIMYCITF